MSTLAENDRRKHNAFVALVLIESGCPVFPCNPATKTPLIPGWQFRDASMSKVRRETIRADSVERNGFEPAHIGATLNKATVHKVLREFPDAVFGIPCGLAGVVVIDADQKDSGPQLLAEFVEENGGWPDGVVTIPTRAGGQHHYFLNDAALTNAAGGMKKLGCDIRGVNGLCIAPGSWRIDGGRYGTIDDLGRFAKAYSLKNLVPLPSFIKSQIGEAVLSQPNPNANKEIKAVLSELRAGGMAEGGDDDVAEEIGAATLIPWFNHFRANEVWEDNSASVYRFRFLQMVRAIMPDLSAGEGLSILTYVSDHGLKEVGQYVGDRVKDRDETGLYTLANFSRDWNQSKWSRFNPGFPTLGLAFGAVKEV